MEINWIQIGIGAASGGLAGALLKQFLDTQKNRLQPINYSFEMKPFYDSTSHSIIPSQIILKEGNMEYSFKNLIIGSLIIKNAGNLYFSEFRFGLTFLDDAKCINIKQEDEHRHHFSTYSAVAAMNNQLELLDVTLKPFNSRNIYKFNFLITTPNYGYDGDDLVLEVTSAQAARLNRVGQVKPVDLALEYVKPIFTIGPLKIILGK